MKTGPEAIEAYLKLRVGESREAYSQRLGRWLAEGDPELSVRIDKLYERGLFERDITLLMLSLARYRGGNGEYPETFKALGEPVLIDPFSGKEMVYGREGNGYVMYSFGYNLKDDHGAEDDIVMRVEK